MKKNWNELTNEEKIAYYDDLDISYKKMQKFREEFEKFCEGKKIQINSCISFGYSFSTKWDRTHLDDLPLLYYNKSENRHMIVEIYREAELTKDGEEKENKILEELTEWMRDNEMIKSYEDLYKNRFDEVYCIIYLK